MRQAGNAILSECRRRRPLPPAFTLIELLASSLLAAMLMVVIAGLMRTASAQGRAVRRALDANSSTSILADQIRRDFGNARYVEVRSNQIRLSGYMAQDMRTGRQTFRPAEVTYAIVAKQRSTWLVRQETQFDQVSGKRTRLDVMWGGASALEVVTLDDSDTMTSSVEAPPGMSLMPSCLVFAIHDRDGGTVFRENIIHHHTIQ